MDNRVRRIGGGVVAVLVVLASVAGVAKGESVYEKDMAFALEELPKYCGKFFEVKKIDWAAVSKQFREEAKGVKTDQEHLVLLARLVARLKDGHATVQPLEKGKGVKWPEDPKGPVTGPGMFWCKIGEGIYVKNSWATAEAAGVKAGMEVLRVDGKPVKEWVAAKMAERSDKGGYSTEQQAFFSTLHWGLAGAVGTKTKLMVKDLGGSVAEKTVVCQRAAYIPWGPAFFPQGLKGNQDVRYGKLKSGYGYVQLRRCPANLPEQMDEALAALGNVPGMILDFRANGGGGFDHDGFMGRFVPAGKQMAFGKRYQSAGANPYAGPVVVIVDALTRSAGETGSGMFKEDGRGYVIGESATAGMSSSKRTIELPSGLFGLYVSVSSNMGRFNGGRGIEGIGVGPHEVVQYDPKDLAKGVDTLTKRAEEILAKWPVGKVKYDPKAFGWKP